MAALVGALALALGACAPGPVAPGPDAEAFAVTTGAGAPRGRALLGPPAGGGSGLAERIEVDGGRIRVEAAAWPEGDDVACQRREVLDRTRTDTRVGGGAWERRRGPALQRAGLAGPVDACLAEATVPGDPGWRIDLLPWALLLDRLPDEPGERLDLDAVDLGGGAPRPLSVEARERAVVEVGGAPVEAVRAFAHTAGEGRVIWYAPGRLLSVESPLEQVRIAREGFVPPAPPRAPIPAGVEEIPWVLETPALRLAGTVTRPVGPGGPWPVVLFLHGSGPVDRDGGAGALSAGTFRTLAHAFALHGIASVRWDKRGVGGSVLKTGEPSATLSDLAGDARAWIDHLVVMPGLDPTRVLLVGHSEGGYLAPLVATLDARVRGIALLGGPASRLDAVMRDQLALLLAAHGASPVEVERAGRRQAAMLRLVASGRDRDLSPPGWGRASAAWLRSHMAHDPAATLAAVRVPVLALFGAVDLQVPVAEAARMETLLAGRTDARVEVLDGVDHLFKPVDDQPGMGLYADPDRRLDPRVAERLVPFLRAAASVGDRPPAEPVPRP